MDAIFPLCVCLDFFLHPPIDADKDLESEARKRVGNADVAEKSSTEATCAGRGFLAVGAVFPICNWYMSCVCVYYKLYIKFIYYKFWLKGGRTTSYNLGDLRFAYVPLSAVPVFCNAFGHCPRVLIFTPGTMSLPSVEHGKLNWLH